MFYCSVTYLFRWFASIYRGCRLLTIGNFIAHFVTLSSRSFLRTEDNIMLALSLSYKEWECNRFTPHIVLGLTIFSVTHSCVLIATSTSMVICTYMQHQTKIMHTNWSNVDPLSFTLKIGTGYIKIPSITTECCSFSYCLQACKYLWKEIT